jgi:hypothetical protein
VSRRPLLTGARWLLVEDLLSGGKGARFLGRAELSLSSRIMLAGLICG